MQSRTTLITLCLLASCMQVRAEQVTEPPSDELLDFLGQWQQVDGEWIDPTQMQEISMLGQNRLKGEKDED